MMRMLAACWACIVAATLLLLGVGRAYAATDAPPPPPAQAASVEALSEDYTLRIDGRQVPVHACRVSAMPFNQVWPGYQRPPDQTELAGFASWSMMNTTSQVSVEIVAKRACTNVVVRPSSRMIKAKLDQDGHTIRFTLASPGQFTVECDGFHNVLHLFADSPEQETVPVPAQAGGDAARVRYFGPGVHHPGKIQLGAGQTLYVAEGAVVHTCIDVRNASNVRILGRGIIDSSEYDRDKGGGCIRLTDCTNVKIDGLILRDPDVWCLSAFGCRNLEIANVKLVGLWRYNADGLDICNSEDVVIRNSFVRAFDDAIVLKGLNWGPNGFQDRPVKNVRVRDMVLWCDWGRALEIGAETSAPEIADVRFSNSDIIRTTHIAMDIQCGDRALVHNIRYEDIRVETDDVCPEPRMQANREERYPTQAAGSPDYVPNLMVIVIGKNPYSQDTARGNVRDVVYSNVSVSGRRMPHSYFAGLDAGHTVEGVLINGLYFNGKRLADAASAHIAIGGFASPAQFKAPSSASGVTSNSLILNEDDSHFFGARAADQMTLDGLHAWVDQYANTAVSHLFLCPNAMKASYGSRVRDPIWELKDGQHPPKEDFAKLWVQNAKLLQDRGLDPYAIWISRCREKKISPWLSMRMNDVHNADDVDNYIHSSFWRKHPEYWRVPGGAGWTDRALDFGFPEVRSHAMALVRELLERYDPDGLELDWMRFGYHFHPGREAEGAKFLTEFMREARALTREWSLKRGHPIRLGARAPTLPESAKGLGMDGVTWAREGLVDLLIPTPFWATTDFDIPVETWKAAIGEAGRNVVITAGAEILVRASPGAEPIEADLTSTRGFAAAEQHRGSTGVYLFNYMDPGPMTGGREAYTTLLKEGLTPATIATKPRRHVVTYRDTVAPGMSNDARLPVPALKGGTFKLYIGKAPSKGDGRILAGLAAGEELASAQLEFTINGKACQGAPDQTDLSTCRGVTRGIRATCPANSLVDGYNEIVIKQKPGTREQKLVWVELQIQPD